MAVLINGARVAEQIYEFGVEFDDGKIIEMSYEMAKLATSRGTVKLKMRCIYKTEWMEGL